MKRIEKPKLSKKQLAAIILSAVFVVMLAVSITVALIVNNIKEANTPTKQPEILEGEARQNGLTLAYPTVNEKKQIQNIAVKNGNGEYGFVKLDGDTYFTMYYVDADGEQQIFMPGICGADSDFNYEDLLAVESSDGFSRYTVLDYLCLGLQLPYFEERIPISENADAKAAQFKEYGFTGQAARTVYFDYVDELGNKKSHTVRIGDKGVTGTGYYFIVDDRPYIYTSINNYYDYAVSPFSRYLKASLVSAGLSSDKGFGPLLTTGYYQWLNEKHSAKGDVIPEDSKVLAYTDIVTPTENGYKHSGYDVIEIDLKAFKNDKNYRRMISALVGKKNGVQTPEIRFTVTSASKYIEFGEKKSLKYEYLITAVEAILADSGEITSAGNKAGSQNDFVKVTYTLKIDGKAVSEKPMHAVIDLTSPLIPDAAEEKIRNTPIRVLYPSEYVSFTVDYTTQTAPSIVGKYKITEIISICDSDGKELSKVSGNAIVTYRYQVEIGDSVVEESTFVLDLSKATGGVELEIKNALDGKGVSTNLDIAFKEETYYHECFLDFATYNISRIDAFITSKLISAFRFQNSSDRDPYYGESLYENLMEDEHRLYGLNAGTCETVVKILGGITDGSASSTADGLFGGEVVAVGLTPEIKEKYGLYAHTIYFELPRRLYALPGKENTDELDDYAYYETIGFTLYISDVDPVTDTRYIASDLYDVVTTVPAKDFVFLDYDFETFWARRNIILMDVTAIETMGIEFFMSDLKGGYLLDLIHDRNAKYETASGHVQTFTKTTVFVMPKVSGTANKLTAFMTEKGYKDGVSLTEFYNYYYPNDSEIIEVYPDSLGTAYFKEAIKMIYLTSFVDVMPEEDRADAMKPEKLVMRMTMEITSSAYEYVYEFYRADDRRVLVSIHKEDANGKVVTTPVSDFYISTFAFKKLATNFAGLLDAEKITPDVGYVDEIGEK